MLQTYFQKYKFIGIGNTNKFIEKLKSSLVILLIQRDAFGYNPCTN